MHPKIVMPNDNQDKNNQRLYQPRIETNFSLEKNAACHDIYLLVVHHSVVLDARR